MDSNHRIFELNGVKGNSLICHDLDISASYDRRETWRNHLPLFENINF